MVSVVLFAVGCAGSTQAPGVARSTPARRQQRQQQQQPVSSDRLHLDSASAADRARMVARLGLPMPPPLAPASTDPNRPPHIFQRPGSKAWHDSAGNLYVRSPWGVWSNYDEARVPPYTLPDPLVLDDGRRVTTAAAWWTRRRPELLAAFQTQVYGRIPDPTPPVRFTVAALDSTTFAGRVVVKTVIGAIDNAAYPAAAPRIEITLYLPPHAVQVPVVTVAIGGAPAGDSPQLPLAAAQTLALGWAYATVNTGAVQADNGAGLTTGIIGLVTRGQPRAPDAWGTLAAWSWGLSRALDYFATDPAIDVTRAALQGHSRWGKAALLAGALDQRWAIVFSSCSGAMGASLEKRNWGETIDDVTGVREYHWMAGNFLRYGGRWDAFPVDAHLLIALVAPRPIFLTGGTHDQWSDPHGTFLAAAGADPVYRLLGARGLGTTAMPAPDVALTDGALAFRNHEGGHTDAPDWPVFLQFARRYFARGAGR